MTPEIFKKCPKLAEIVKIHQNSIKKINLFKKNLCHLFSEFRNDQKRAAENRQARIFISNIDQWVGHEALLGKKWLINIRSSVTTAFFKQAILVVSKIWLIIMSRFRKFRNRKLKIFSAFALLESMSKIVRQSVVNEAKIELYIRQHSRMILCAESLVPASWSALFRVF